MKTYCMAVLSATTLLIGASTVGRIPQMISQKEAIDIAEADGGFLGTWVQACLGSGIWQISASSKSAKPPVLYLISVNTSEIVYRTGNSDEPVSFKGVAVNEADGPVIETDKGLRIYVDGLRQWPKNLVAKRVAVTGRLQSRESVETQGTGDVPHESSTTKFGSMVGPCTGRGRLIFQDAQWKRTR